MACDLCGHERTIREWWADAWARERVGVERDPDCPIEVRGAALYAMVYRDVPDETERVRATRLARWVARA